MLITEFLFREAVELRERTFRRCARSAILERVTAPFVCEAVICADEVVAQHAANTLIAGRGSGGASEPGSRRGEIVRGSGSWLRLDHVEQAAEAVGLGFT
jgi:hypothetical protein